MLSFRSRLALAHQAAIVVVLAATALAGHWLLSRAVHGQLDAALLALAEAEVGMLADDTALPVRIHEVPAGPAPPSFDRLDRLVQIADADGRVLARSANLGAARLPTPPALLARLARGEVVFETLPGYGTEPTRMVSVPVPGSGPSAGPGHGPLRAIQVAGSLDDVNHVVRSASVLFLGMGLALLAAVGLAGALLTRRAFGAIDDVVQQARRIGEAHLGRRLPHPGSRDEIGRLVETLNDMLARIERSFDAQHRFSADASHELRSPLSRLRTELEVALRRPRSAADYVLALRSCVEEVERLTRLVDELLTLARLDAGEERGRPETVSLNALADEAVQRLRPRAAELGVQVEVEPGPAVHAAVAPGAAGLVLANLLDNAIKFSPPGGRVRLRLAVDQSQALLIVTDTGPGISITELPHLFDRFFRGSAARAGTAPGVGLGLSLSQAIVQVNGGSIDAANGPQGGAVFTVRLRLVDG